MKTDHSTTKGYPYDTIISQERFKIRPNIILDRNDKNKTKFWINEGDYPGYRKADWLQRLFARDIIDFLEFRIFDYAEALFVAETQIAHLQEEQPFLPEDFGFVKTVGPKEIFDNPTKIYTSRYNESVSLFQNDDEECEWHLLERIHNNAGNTFKDTKLQLPNHRIAYAAFLALGVRVEEDKSQAQEIIRDEKEEMKEFVAWYAAGMLERTPWEHVIKLKAYDEEDARDRAKFIFETGEFGLDNVNSKDIKFLNN